MEPSHEAAAAYDAVQNNKERSLHHAIPMISAVEKAADEAGATPAATLGRPADAEAAEADDRPVTIPVTEAGQVTGHSMPQAFEVPGAPPLHAVVPGAAPGQSSARAARGGGGDDSAIRAIAAVGATGPIAAIPGSNAE